MNHPTPADKPDTKTWLIALAALFFVNIVAPGLAAFSGLLAGGGR